jgi:hypothetical protein
VLWPRRSGREGNPHQLLIVAEEPGHRDEENRKRTIDGLEMTAEASESRQDRFSGAWCHSGITGGFSSLTALFLDQVNRKPWTDELNTPRKNWAENQADNAKLRATILEYAKNIGKPINAREIIDLSGSDKSRVNAALKRHEREGNLRRFNYNGRLHWVLT